MRRVASLITNKNYIIHNNNVLRYNKYFNHNHGNSFRQRFFSSAEDTSNEAILESFLQRVQKEPKMFERVWSQVPESVRADMLKPILANLPLPQKTISSEFIKADKSQDGVLDKQEFEHWLTQNMKRAAVNQYKVAEASEAGNAAAASTTANVSKEVTKDQLKKLAVMSAIPFVGFGFLDNAVMITAGSQIDAAFSAFGISAMAAAALGNTVSDVAGIKAGGFIEMVSAKLGLPDPMLTTEQLKTSAVKRTTLISSAIGIAVGCILGMLPLLFIDDDHSLKKVFNEIDVDNSGDISFEELQVAVRGVGLSVDKDELRKAFRAVAIDLDHERITFKEFKKLVAAFEKRVKEEGLSID